MAAIASGENVNVDQSCRTSSMNILLKHQEHTMDGCSRTRGAVCDDADRRCKPSWGEDGKCQIENDGRKYEIIENIRKPDKYLTQVEKWRKIKVQNEDI